MVTMVTHHVTCDLPPPPSLLVVGAGPHLFHYHDYTRYFDHECDVHVIVII